MNKITLLAGVAAMLTLVGAGCQGNAGADLTAGNSGTNQGKVIFSITDAAANMRGVTAVRLTVDKIEMHSQTENWVTVSNDTKTFDLLALKASAMAKLAAESTVAAGTYNQIRLQVQKIVVVKNGVESEAKLPSNELKLSGIFKVGANATTSITLDVIADLSLHLTGSGKFIFAPVVKLESRSNAEVRIGPDGAVTISGGQVDVNIMIGMDLKGEEKADFKVDADSKLEVNEAGDIEIKIGTTSLRTDNGLKVKVGGDVQY